jgi:hypothetical protein
MIELQHGLAKPNHKIEIYNLEAKRLVEQNTYNSIFTRQALQQVKVT